MNADATLNKDPGGSSENTPTTESSSTASMILSATSGASLISPSAAPVSSPTLLQETFEEPETSVVPDERLATIQSVALPSYILNGLAVSDANTQILKLRYETQIFRHDNVDDNGRPVTTLYHAGELRFDGGVDNRKPPNNGFPVVLKKATAFFAQRALGDPNSNAFGLTGHPIGFLWTSQEFVPSYGDQQAARPPQAVKLVMAATADNKHTMVCLLSANEDPPRKGEHVLQFDKNPGKVPAPFTVETSFVVVRVVSVCLVGGSMKIWNQNWGNQTVAVARKIEVGMSATGSLTVTETEERGPVMRIGDAVVLAGVGELWELTVVLGRRRGGDVWARFEGQLLGWRDGPRIIFSGMIECCYAGSGGIHPGRKTRCRIMLWNLVILGSIEIEVDHHHVLFPQTTAIAARPMRTPSGRS